MPWKIKKYLNTWPSFNEGSVNLHQNKNHILNNLCHQWRFQLWTTIRNRSLIFYPLKSLFSINFTLFHGYCHSWSSRFTHVTQSWIHIHTKFTKYFSFRQPERQISCCTTYTPLLYNPFLIDERIEKLVLKKSY